MVSIPWYIVDVLWYLVSLPLFILMGSFVRVADYEITVNEYVAKTNMGVPHRIIPIPLINVSQSFQKSKPHCVAATESV